MRSRQNEQTKPNMLFLNFNVIDKGEITKGMPVYISNGKIEAVPQTPDDNTEIIDGRSERYLSAGFIDIHTHGGGGFDFMDADPAEYNAISRHHTSHGTTALYPTTVSASREELVMSVKAFKEAKKLSGGAALLGLHLEGPYLAMSQKGAMDPKYIRNPVPDEYMELCEISDDIKRITLAPELDGSIELCSYLKKRGIVASIGHTDAVCSDVKKAFKEGGCRLMTHLYSAMSMTRRIGINRFGGAVEAAYLLDDMYVEIIADGIHLPEELLKLIYKINGDSRIALITDSMRGSGMEQGSKAMLGSRKNGLMVLIEDGVAKLPDHTAFAGSIATADRLIKTMINTAGVSLQSAVKMMTAVPAQIMNV
jgi:N-acetylglucosamine-6-phosphate deacetylase